MKRKFELTIDENTIPVSVSDSDGGKLTITIGEDTYSASVIDGNREKGIFQIAIGKEKFEIHISPKSGSKDFSLTVNGQKYTAVLKPIGVTPEPIIRVAKPVPVASRTPLETSSSITAVPTTVTLGTVTAPLPGRIVDVNVSVGDKVKRGDVILVLEAMKMLNQIRASQDGIVSEVHVQAGKPVEKGQPLVTIK